MSPLKAVFRSLRYLARYLRYAKKIILEGKRRLRYQLIGRTFIPTEEKIHEISVK